MNICILAAGAGGMYCGSCMRDNALASALKRLGHDVTLIPLYTPIRTENHTDAAPDVFYGGVNVYLQHWSGVFRHTPRILDWLFDRPWLLAVAGRFGINTPPEKLAGLTLDILKGEDGAAEKELRRLLAHLKLETPRIICLPNLMFVGMARLFRRELNIPVVCELTGEDIFLDAMQSADREQLRSVIRARAADVTRFVASSDYYAGAMAEYLGIARDQIDVVYTGISGEYFQPNPSPTPRPLTVGYLARICPEKGFHQILEAMRKLIELPGMADTQLKVAGYLGGRDEKWARGLLDGLAGTPMASAVTFLGEVSREKKLEMLDSIDVLTVPTVYPESKGVYILEALARGVPVVQPDHGSFPELIRMTGGGLLTPPGNADALAAALAGLLRDPATRLEMGRRGRASVESTFTDGHMAEKMLRVFESLPSNGGISMTVTSPAMRSDAAATSGGLVVRNLHKEYPTPAAPLVVLRGVSFSLSPGNTLAIVGPSGSGKSTLLNILGTLDRPTAGSISLGGVDPFSLSPAKLALFRSERIGFVFQDHHLLPQCTAVENVLIARMAVGRVTDENAKRAAELLRRVGLEGRARHLPGELSGGERQRVAVARALMNQPSVLLADEPTGNLDARSSQEVGELLKELSVQSNSILIVVTHSPILAAMFAKQLKMQDGMLV